MDHQPSSFPQGYPFQQPRQTQGTATPQQPQTSTSAATPAQPQHQQQQQQPVSRAPYAPMGSYSYDQSQVYGYQQMPQQQQAHQQQQQPHQPQQSQSAAPQSSGSIPSSTSQQFTQPMFQPQQQFSSSALPQYQYGSGYPLQQAYSQAPNPSTYGFPPYGVPQPSTDHSPYKPQTQLSGGSSGSNINMAQIRGPLQSATQPPPMMDPNQVPQRPKLTTTFWEDENTVCYQVEARGISVSRREDTNFINGTKLLNVAGMTRGRRDGILKSEKVRYVVKIGAMNLKGVWIPFERALELARNEGIVDLLYPLFVKDIKELYQGPQYSGGLTAAANSNPKSVIPVTVTSSSYNSAIYPPKDKKPDDQQQQQPQSQPPQQQQYGYGYQPYQYGQYYGYQHSQQELPEAEKGPKAE